MTVSLDSAAVELLRRHLRGGLHLPGDNHYDAARHVFNAMIDRRPALIVRPANVTDIQHAVEFARAHDLPVSVKGGGHNVAGSAVSADGLMLDCGGMRSVQVDASNYIAIAEPGALLFDLDRATQAHGLATPLGVVSVTGIAGLTLGGGVGWLNGKYGLACDNLIAAEVVTADGQVVTASVDEDADLLWAIRGGGGNFGVVTLLTYQLHAVGPVLAGSLAFSPDRAREAIRAYGEFAASCPDELSMAAGPGVDAAGRPTFGVSLCWCGSHDEGERALRELRALGPSEDTVASVEYGEFQAARDSGYPLGRLHYWKSSYLTQPNDEVIDLLFQFAAEKPSAASGIGLQQFHGAAARVDPSATAFPHRRAQHELLVLSQWANPADTERNIAWTRALFSAVQPFAERGVYVNDLGEEGEDRIREAFGVNYGRLADLKARYDPTNLFRSNQNIRPTG